MPKRRWRIGELADATGMTVRALHHYELTGLLLASGRSQGDHRLYDELTVERLYRIRALKGLGMSLEEIKTVIEDSSAFADTLRAHLARVELSVKGLTHLRDRLRSITNAGDPVSTDDLLVTLEAMSQIEKHARTRLLRSGNPGNDVESRWRALADSLRACMNAGEDPASERVRTIATEARSRIETFANGDPAILKALARLRVVDPPRDLVGWDPELMRYLDRALAAL